MLERFIYMVIITTSIVLCVASCSKTCECQNHTPEGYPTEDEPIEQVMPRTVKLDCSFFDTFNDTIGGYKCF